MKKENMMRKKLIAIMLATATLATLAGCQNFDPSTTVALENADSHKPKALTGVDEQRFYTREITDKFGKWISKAGWSGSYEVDGSPIETIPVKQNEAFPSTVSLNSCSAWVRWESGYQASAITTSIVYRVVNDKKAANSEQLSELFDHLSSDMQRQGWAKYDVTEFGSAEGSAGQRAWYSPAVDGADYVPIESYLPGVLGEANVDYISYRIMIADRGDGYVALYVSAPCAPIEEVEYQRLKGDTGSAEIDLIQSDTKNPDNTGIRR